jgi:hypothetical protein
MGETDWLAEISARAEPDLVDRFSPAWIETKAEDALALIDDTAPAALGRLVSGKISARTFIRIVCDMVLRVMRNPSGLKSEGDGVYTYSSSQTAASADLWIPAKDFELLRGPDSFTPVGTIKLRAERGWGL